MAIDVGFASARRKSVCSWAQRRSDTPKVIHRRVYQRERVLDSLAKRSGTGGGNQSWPVTLE
jgi:hypothetical protein